MVVLSEQVSSISLKERLLAYIRERFESWNVAVEAERTAVHDVSLASIYQRLYYLEFCDKSLRANGFHGGVSGELAKKTLAECEALGFMEKTEIRDWRKRFGLINEKTFDTV